MGLLKKLRAANGEEGEVGQDDDGSEYVPVPEPVTDKGDRTSEKPQDAAPVLEDDPVPPEIQKLEDALRRADWWYEGSDDPQVRLDGAREFSEIEALLAACVEMGCGGDAQKIWEKYAPSNYATHTLASPSSLNTESPGTALARRPGAPFSDPYVRRLFTMPGIGNGVHAQPPAATQNVADGGVQHDAMSYGGGGASNLLAQAIAAPFTIVGAAGSLIVDGLKSAGEKVRGFYAKGRENGHSILSGQLDAAAATIESLTTTLRAQGMGDLIADMRSTGRPASELFQGMVQGGPHQHFSDRFSSLMKNESFAENYAKLEESLSAFGFMAAQYAQTGVELDRDYSDAIERNLEKISAATEGFIFKKDGVIKHLQELARSIAESISDMINRMLGRHQPQQ